VTTRSTTARFAAVSAKSDRCARARNANSSTPSASTASGSSGQHVSPTTCRRSRLVTMNAASAARSIQAPTGRLRMRDDLLEVVEDERGSGLVSRSRAQLHRRVGLPSGISSATRRRRRTPSSVRASERSQK
jgi:hypothetical protein